MIYDILKDHKSSDKPRFFLHDEMIEWLKENLTIVSTIKSQKQVDDILKSKLQLEKDISVGFTITISMYLGNEKVKSVIENIDLNNIEVYKKLTHYLEKSMFHIVQLEEKIKNLEDKQWKI